MRSPDVETAAACGVHVDSIRLGIWSHGEVVAVRGRLLADAGLPGRGITNEAFMAMHSGPALP